MNLDTVDIVGVSLSLETSRLLLYRDYFLLPFSFFFLPLTEDCFFRDLNAARSQV